MFSNVLIANRGEIAVRIAQAVQEMGIRAVAVYSEPDQHALHVRVADDAYALAGSSSEETYLRGDLILEIAQTHGVDAIHPGYGFLAENAAFAEACAEAGIVFIGPSPEAIRAMGDKIVAKETMVAAGVPVVPGWSGDDGGAGSSDVGDDALSRAADRIGYPVLVKAAGGGGGKGMRVIDDPDALSAGVAAARREAGSAFGDARVFLEKYLADARHVEFQIFGDAHGGAVHLFERECSIQRRHQKIIEESPAPGMTETLRKKMGVAAIKAAQAIRYTGAGTVEFLLAPSGEFYFLEVNTRLQVEHPVTELVTGHDLVRAQLLVAAGEPMPFTQAELSQRGHAIECRVYAEDPARGFFPSTGTIEFYRAPTGANVRVDSGVAQGSAIDVYYDPMLAKLIVWGRDREEALSRMRWALKHYVVLGVTTNIDFLQDVIAHPEFVAGNINTRFLEEHTFGGEVDVPDEAVIVAALAARSGSRSGLRSGARAGAGASSRGSNGFPTLRPNPWVDAGHWRSA